MSETGPDLSLDLAKNELVKEGNLTPETNDDHLTPTGAQNLANAMYAAFEDLLGAYKDDEKAQETLKNIFANHLNGEGFEVGESNITYILDADGDNTKDNLDITEANSIIDGLEGELVEKNFLEPEGMLGSLEGFASVAGFNELMEENGVPEEHRDMIMEWVAGFLDMLEETLGLDIGSDLRDLSFTKANGDQALDIAGEAGISLDNIGGTPGLAAFRKDFFNLNKGDGADMDFKDFFENQLDPKASQNKGTALGAVLARLETLGDGQLTLTPSQILDLREVSAKAKVEAVEEQTDQNGNVTTEHVEGREADQVRKSIDNATSIDALAMVVSTILSVQEGKKAEFAAEHMDLPGAALFEEAKPENNDGRDMTSAAEGVLEARYGVQAVEQIDTTNKTAQITLANSVQLQVAYGQAGNPPGNHNASTATITLALGSDDGAPQANYAEKDLPSVLAALGALDDTDDTTSIEGLTDNTGLASAIHENLKTTAEAAKLSKEIIGAANLTDLARTIAGTTEFDDEFQGQFTSALETKMQQFVQTGVTVQKVTLLNDSNHIFSATLEVSGAGFTVKADKNHNIFITNASDDTVSNQRIKDTILKPADTQ